MKVASVMDSKDQEIVRSEYNRKNSVNMKSVTVARTAIDKLTVPNGQSVATTLRIEGNLLLDDGKLFEALECYNKSLCVAQSNSHDLSSAYECRSVVYLEARKYQLCLDNIELARKYCDDVSRLEILAVRKKLCEELIGYYPQCNADDDPWKFFQLSYGANHKIPSIVDCLELHTDENFGRFIITNQDLQPGDIIAIEEPFFMTVTSESSHTRCTNCLKSNKLNLFPSTTSQTAMFCSVECMEVATKTFFHADCKPKMHDIKQRMLLESLAICGGSFNKLKQLVDATDLRKQTVFDFDLTHPNDPLCKYNLLMSIMSLSQIATVSNEAVWYLSHHPILDTIKDDADREIAKSFLLRCFRILTVNSFGIEWVVPARPRDITKDTIITQLVGDAICPFGSLINHSCTPNVDRVFVDNKFVFFVRQPISKGQQLFISYGALFLDIPREIRQQNLADEYGFLCCCDACVGDYPTSAIYPWTGIPLIIGESLEVIEWKTEFAKNCSKIVRKQNLWSHSELCLIMMRNLYLLVAIAKTEPFIF